MINVLGEKLVKSLREFQSKAVDQVAKRSLHGLGQNLLSLNTKRADVAIRFKEVQELRAVGHPKCQDSGIRVLLLDYAVDQISHMVQEHG